MTPPVLAAEHDTLTGWLAGVDWLDVVVTAAQVVVVIVVAAIATRYARRGVYRWVSRATTRTLERADEAKQVRAELRARTLGKVMAETTTIVIWVIAVTTTLVLVGIPVGPLLAGAGIIGVAVGFGAQALVRDFLSGFFILLEDQYGVGDNIRIREDVAGRVEDITLRVTRLRSIDGTVWFVPNGEIRELGNRSKEWSRALVDIEVAYGETVEEVIPVIREVAAELRRDPEFGPKILEDIEILGVEQFGASGVTIRTYLKTVPLEQFAVARRFRQEVKRAFDDLGIEIPFPHRKLVFAEDDDQGTPARRVDRARRRDASRTDPGRRGDPPDT
jgi:moderate conductance mechanosensitive channel